MFVICLLRFGICRYASLSHIHYLLNLTTMTPSFRTAPNLTALRDHPIKTLRGPKVILREKQLEDATNDFAWATVRELTRLNAAEPYQTPFAIYLSQYPKGIADPNKRQFAIETLEGKHIGNCVCYNVDWTRREAELGIMIGDRVYWGQGYGADAVKTLMQYAFEDMGMQRLFLHTLEWNIRAQECFERCGFTPCGRIVVKDHEFIEMELLRDQFDGIEYPIPESSD